MLLDFLEPDGIQRLDYLLENVLHCSHEYVKPDGMLLGYPVITSGIDAHRASFERSLGKSMTSL